ncbi:hypothetical protein [Sporosarcina sp. Te-1]|uniref:hypothetical protein n=1 Tax=Sporosarcina sp. Te-1 TaxID=2818390 RepID=UPI001A9EB88C|nr:hypothetical protein [Sporosarcina sp. Te-1]QTD41881.1 hypothetical protein J3U78_03225 [Sporosarcina sp. Te-1]
MKINEKYGKVTIDNFELDGQIEQEKYCSKCQFNLIYYDDFDTYFCPECNSWFESKCSDPICKYCSNRPEKPLPHK